MTATVLSLPLGWLRLSDRTAQMCQDAGLAFVGDVAALSAVALLSLPNSSRKTLNEVERTLKRLGLTLETPIVDWDHDVAKASLTHCADGLADLAAGSCGRSAPLGQGLTAALRNALAEVGESTRNIDMIMANLGWAGAPPRCQAAVAKDFGISLDRFNTIRARALGRLRRGPAPGAVQCLAQYLERSGCPPAPGRSARLMVEGLSDRPLSDQALRNLFDVFGLEPTFEVLSADP